MNRNIVRLSVTTALCAVSIGQASAQSAFGTGSTQAVIEGTAASTVTDGASTTATTGDSTVAPFQNTTTTVVQQTVNSTTPSTTETFSTTVGGVSYTNGTVTASGTGTANQTSTSSRLDTFNPGTSTTPPTLATSVESGPVVAPVGTPTVTAVTASGSVGDANYYQSVLTSSGALTNGSVVATENTVALTSSGVVFERRVGTATYSPTTGAITVALPTAATNTVSINATGIDMGNQRLTGLAAGTSATDAVNLSQLNAVTTSLNASMASFQSSVNSTLAGFSNRLDRFEEEANAGTAIAIALGGGAFLPDRKINLTVNYGNYEGESAIAGQIGVLVNENIALNAGVATGFDRGGTGFRVGGTVGF